MGLSQPEPVRCPDCGSELVSEPGIPGLCPQCLLSLALLDSGRDEDPGELETLDGQAGGPGRILGDRYQVRELLGRGGMGEVWRAFDLKLRVDVALKAVRAGRPGAERAVEMLRREVRSAREVVSPNVCRVFDLVEEDGREYVSMEYVDGTTLGEVMRERGPLGLRESREIASQFLSGLEAIHVAGLVHRDFKPENVMVTRAGRVVVMDFGLAKGRAEGRTGTVSGTPAYMSPEQARGEDLDARADVFAAGVVLSEMVSVGGAGAFEARQALWRGVRDTPPRVPEGPWAPVLRQALAASLADRPASARALAQALEEVTQRLPGFEEKRPYPGLSSFTEEDAEYFFGREVETEAVWKKLKRPRLLAVIGPSGAGKSSFLRAGLLPALPPGWKAVVSSPGTRPFQALAQALAPAFAGDTQAVQALLRFEEEDQAVSLLHRLRQRHGHVLLVVDQFEELFTLNPPETQEAFARLLGRLVLESDLHVVLSLRDDFLFRCHAHEALAPILNDLTLLGAINESGLRRALVQPALSCGYRFEDETLVDEMVTEVQKERGALPLLAFAASRLWEKRDRERGLLTREAYWEIGGVAGALAQHAEATLERIGTQRASLVRELFRNLVTSQGTRAVRERSELLSVFEKPAADSAETEGGDPGTRAQAWSRAQAEEVLSALIDARLLTSYERAGEGGESHQQVEIIHESLLSAWPRLVRWQTQDADGAQLRDQLRQAAQLWQDRGRTQDLLWSGTAYRDYTLWRERYRGGLSATEEAFAAALEANATRRRRRRRAAVATLVAVAACVAIVTSVLWQRSETSRQRAEAESRRAEAGKLLALAQIELATYPTAALAYALQSLELADTRDGRLFALRVLQQGPLATIPSSRYSEQDGLESVATAFSPSGEWLATSGARRAQIRHRDGGESVVVGEYPPLEGTRFDRGLRISFAPHGDVLVAARNGDVRALTVPGGRELWRAQGDKGPASVFAGGDGFFTVTEEGRRDSVRWFPEHGAPSRLVGTMETVAVEEENGTRSARDVDAVRGRMAFARGRRIYLRSTADWASAPRLLAEHAADVLGLAFHPDGERLAAGDASGEIRIWLMAAAQAARLTRTIRGEAMRRLAWDPTGRWLAAWGSGSGAPKPVQLWDLSAPVGADPLLLRRGKGTVWWTDCAFDPSGRWLLTGHYTDAALWPIDGNHARVLAGHGGPVSAVRFAPDGQSLISQSDDGTEREWPLAPQGGEASRIVRRIRAGDINDVPGHVVKLVPGGVEIEGLAGGPGRRLTGFSADARIATTALASDGHRLAVAPDYGPVADKVVRVFDLDTGAVQVLGPVPGAGDGRVGAVMSLAFLDRNRLLAGVRPTGLVLFDLRDGSARVLASKPEVITGISRRGDFGIGLQPRSLSPPRRELVRFSFDGRAPEVLNSHGSVPDWAALDPTDTWVASGSMDGTVRVGPVSGEEPHVYYGHEGTAQDVAFSPDGKWLASAGEDKTIRLWPLPDRSRLPFHTLPREELLARLCAFTNLRVVPDPGASTGYRLEAGLFSGWAKPPEW